jgi:hypothetical protein
MSRRVKVNSKDAAALEELVQRLRAVLWNNLVEVKLFGSLGTTTRTNEIALCRKGSCRSEENCRVFAIALPSRRKQQGAVFFKVWVSRR